jgi:hypothetical protein
MVAVLLALPVFEISSEDAWQLVLVECTHLTLSAYFIGELRMLLSIPLGYILSECHLFSESPFPEKAKTSWRRSKHL